MARVKLSEYQSKKIILSALNLPFHSHPLDTSTPLSSLSSFSSRPLVVKVDQGVKKRAKTGLLKLNVSPASALDFVKLVSSQKGYSQFILEEMITHKPSQEKYLSLERTRDGIKVLYSGTGGVDVEENWEKATEFLITPTNPKPDLDDPVLNKIVLNLIGLFDRYHLSFLEINPLVVIGNDIHFLDLAIEIDDAALGLPELSLLNLTPVQDTNVSSAELRVKDLDAQTPASLKLKILNPNGKIWMLLSGGGASLVLADEIADLGFGQDLANYGEYSGNPTTDDTYLYTKIILQELLDSNSSPKVLIIAGGVANFTDVAKTFKGVIQALDEFKNKLKQQNVRVFVRRGGPNQEKGLALMRDFLAKNRLLGLVAGPDHELTEVVRVALDHIKSGEHHET